MNEVSDFWLRVHEAFGNSGVAEIAKTLGITEAGIYKWRSGSSLPSGSTLVEIKRITGYSIDWLLTGEGSKKADSPNQHPVDEHIEAIARRVFFQLIQEENEKRQQELSQVEILHTHPEGKIPVPIMSAEDIWASLQGRQK